MPALAGLVVSPLPTHRHAEASKITRSCTARAESRASFTTGSGSLATSLDGKASTPLRAHELDDSIAATSCLLCDAESLPLSSPCP